MNSLQFFSIVLFHKEELKVMDICMQQAKSNVRDDAEERHEDGK